MMMMVVMVTQGRLRRLTLGGQLFVGGYVNYSAPGPLQRLQSTRRRGGVHGITGCVRRLQINHRLYDTSRGAFIGDALQHANVGMMAGKLGTCCSDCATRDAEKFTHLLLAQLTCNRSNLAF